MMHPRHPCGSAGLKLRAPPPEREQRDRHAPYPRREGLPSSLSFW
ncbi:MAG: hypothetical protein SVX43_07220 [Cyanobacteriota bacterium]|nr:hypothetical protein [Cyanobacteriota bacterium]